ncbi:uncharacterized protein LOC134345339 [Mobula hypostoma]|uniref:uncharacterized protein LOC134345339 n=1 Tax=Mobula hypostoma TaxID=723540 RepID=UPI002FC3BD22
MAMVVCLSSVSMWLRRAGQARPAAPLPWLSHRPCSSADNTICRIPPAGPAHRQTRGRTRTGRAHSRPYRSPAPGARTRPAAQKSLPLWKTESGSGGKYPGWSLSLFCFAGSPSPLVGSARSSWSFETGGRKDQNSTTVETRFVHTGVLRIEVHFVPVDTRLMATSFSYFKALPHSICILSGARTRDGENNNCLLSCQPPRTTRFVFFSLIGKCLLRIFNNYLFVTAS